MPQQNMTADQERPRSNNRLAGERMAQRMLAGFDDPEYQPRNMREVALKCLYERWPRMPEDGGFYGISIKNIAAIARPGDRAAQRSLIDEVSKGARHGRHPGMAMLQLKYGMDWLHRPVIPVTDLIDAFPNWERQDFEHMPANISEIVCGIGRKGHGFLFVSRQRHTAMVIKANRIDQAENIANSTMQRVTDQRGVLRLV